MYAEGFVGSNKKSTVLYGKTIQILDQIVGIRIFLKVVFLMFGAIF